MANIVQMWEIWLSSIYDSIIIM